MGPKAKAKAKVSPTQPGPSEVMYQEVATELGIIGDYKQYRATAENLNKAETKAAQAAKDEAQYPAG